MQGNPILNQINQQRNNLNRKQVQSNPWMQQIKNVMHQVQNSPNPQAALTNMLQNNPNLSTISMLLRANNGDLKQVAQFIANQKGQDLNAIIQELRS